MKRVLTSRSGVAACGWLALAGASIASAGEPIVLTPAALDAVTAGFVASGVTTIADATGGSGAFAATSTTTSAIAGTQVGWAKGDAEALAVAQGDADGFAGTSTINESAAGGAGAATQTSSSALGDMAVATSGSSTRAIDTPGADVGVSTGYASASGKDPYASAVSSGTGDIVIAPNIPTVFNAKGTTARSVAVAVDVPRE